MTGNVQLLSDSRNATPPAKWRPLRLRLRTGRLPSAHRPRLPAKVQYRVGRFRIDLVVEGRHGRLAVELDGDAYHGPDRWEADRRRQAILERLGWTFHRIRGSAYYLDPDALGSLWDRLESIGIRPSDEPAGTSPSPTPLATDVADDAAAAAADVAVTGGKGDDYADTSFGWFGHPASWAPASDGTVPVEPPRQLNTDLETVSEPPYGDTGVPHSAAPAAAEGLPLLAPHRALQPHHVPDVNSALQWAIIEGVVDIVTGEGPVVTDRVYELYVRASGGQRVGKHPPHPGPGRRQRHPQG